MSLKTQNYLPKLPMIDRQVEQWNACAWRG